MSLLVGLELDKFWNYLSETILNEVVTKFPKRFNRLGKTYTECPDSVPWAGDMN